MKRWSLGAAFVLCVACASFFGGIWFTKDRFQAAENESLLLWQHLSSQKSADACLRLMEALESGDTNKLEKFRTRARAVIQGYVEEVTQLRDKKGCQWCPNDSEIFRRAQEFATRFPAQATNVTNAIGKLRLKL